VVEFFPDGALLKVEGLPGWSSEGDGEGTGTRKPIAAFTWKQRRAMLELLAKVRVDARPVFVTLTFPRECRATPESAKEAMRVFLQKLTRDNENLSALWKLEPQEDGTPHFHIFLWGLSFIAWQHIAVRWAEVLHNHATKHPEARKWWKAPKDYPVRKGSEGAEDFRAWLEQFGDSIFAKAASSATKVEAIRERNGVKFYAAKYMAKEVGQLELWEEPGRFWGVYQREKLPLSRRVPFRVEKRAAVKLSRTMRRYLQSKGRKCRHVRRLETTSHLVWLKCLAFFDENGSAIKSAPYGRIFSGDDSNPGGCLSAQRPR